MNNKIRILSTIALFVLLLLVPCKLSAQSRVVRRGTTKGRTEKNLGAKRNGQHNPYGSKKSNTSKRTIPPIIKNLINNMVYVEGGTFTMGGTSEQGSDANPDERPAHKVTLSSYRICKYEVTQEELETVMGTNPSYFKGGQRPVEQVSWNACQKFIARLNAMTGLKFRLPTEAEWEYAARGGNHSRGYKYAGSDNIYSVAGETGRTWCSTHDVGTLQPNELGLYDMSGNVYEWCQDIYGNYHSYAQTNPKGASSGTERVIRGGGWCYLQNYCRVSCRRNFHPFTNGYECGFRLAM